MCTVLCILLGTQTFLDDSLSRQLFLVTSEVPPTRPPLAAQRVCTQSWIFTSVGTRSDTGGAGSGVGRGEEPKAVSAKHFTLNEHQLSLLKTRELTETMEGQKAPPPTPQAPPLGEHGLGAAQPAAPLSPPGDGGCFAFPPLGLASSSVK